MSSTLAVEEGPSAADKRKLKQLIKEADQRVASAEKNHLNSVDMLISAGHMYDEAKKFGRSIGLTLPAALELAGSPVSESFAKQCIKFANTPVVMLGGVEVGGPETAVLEYRQKKAIEVAGYRKRIAGPVSDEVVKARATKAILDLPPEEPENGSRNVPAAAQVAEERFGALEEWVAGPHVADPVERLMVGTKDLSREDLVRFINELTAYARACGLIGG